MKWLVYGHRGWIGQQVIEHISKIYPEDEILTTSTRIDNELSLRQELEQLKPDRVVSLTGRTHGEGYSTIDYLEQPGKLVENVRDNLYGPIVLAMVCHDLGIHFTYLGTGCIFTYDDEHRLDNETGFQESDLPNYFDSSYSVVKGFTDRLMHQYDNVLNVRIRMPIVNRDHPRNFISKITRYAKICSVPNSMTVLDELIPVTLDMARNSKTGTVNMTNPGRISHNEILELYKQYVDPEFTYTNFSIEEQRQVLKCGRSNNLLDTTRLEREYPWVKPIREAVIHTLQNWQN